MFPQDFCLCNCCRPLFHKDEPTNVSPLVQKNEQLVLSQQQLQQQQQQVIEQQKELLKEQQKALRGVSTTETDDPVNEQSLAIGMVEFSIHYDFHTKTLVLKILQAKNLLAMDLGGTSDPYVKVNLLPETGTTLCTEVKHKNCNPKWNETFEFEEYPYQKVQDMTLFMQVLDYDKFTKDDPIGELRIPMSRFDLVNGQKLWKNLSYSHGKTIGRLGDLLLELSYDCPLLKITVVRAKQLKSLDLNGTSDPYVSVWLVCDGQKEQKHKTTVKNNTLEPVFNQTFDFDVPLEKIRHVSLEVSVMDYDRFGKDEAIGQIVLGSKTTPEQQKHWNEMFHNPRKVTSRWHVLREYD